MNVQAAVTRGGDSRLNRAAADRSGGPRGASAFAFRPHCMEQVVDPATYDTLLAALPDRGFFHYLKHHDAVRKDGSSTRLRMYLIPNCCGGFRAAAGFGCRSPGALLARPRTGVQAQVPLRARTKVRESRREDPDEAIPILLRDQPGYRIGIHSDVARKAITVQFYLPADESQRDIGTIFHEGKDGKAANRTTQMPFLPASGYAFPVALTKSWHSAATASDADGERVSMMVTYYVAESPFRRLKLALGRAALRLGIHPRG